MDFVEKLTELDGFSILIGILIILAAAKYVIEMLAWAFDKCGIQFKWIESRNSQRKLLESTVEKLDNLKVMGGENEKKINSLSEEVKEINKIVVELDKRSAANEKATIESLYNTISSLCDRYINELKGVPCDQITELTNLMDAYVGCGGNHGLQTKVDYCLHKLPLLPPKFKEGF